ncbi:MAG: D-alanyl-D-alanine carboxypeptidase family protein [Clostridia bacterium]|nr:D-alanyl-D-alanine carboxypeptidase family protein [Clostridia bacterium]
MKKWLAVIMMCMLVISSLTLVYATYRGNLNDGYAIEINGESTEYTSIVSDGTHYVPMRMIFEKMGAYVFYRGSDRQILALSRDGDIIRHIVGDNVITVNGEQKVFGNTSISQDDGTYLPVEMITVSLCPDAISYDNRKLNIQKYMANTDYHLIIKDVLDVCRESDFYPERFQRYINYHIKTPDYNMQEVVCRVNIGLDFPFYENVSVIEHPYELLVLVNKYHQLPSGFNQYNLVKMSREYTVNDGKQYLLSAVAYEKYVQMADDAKKDGLTMKVVSAYRTEDYQKNLYNNKVRTTGKVNADNYSARPGFSEHQTGLAVDISSTKGVFEYTPEFKWLQKHAHEYGYILRYPKGKEWITGYSYEPWHYRYVGTDVATIIYEEGITYEEYCAKYVSLNEFR